MFSDLYRPEEVNTVIGALTVAWAIMKWISPLFAGFFAYYIYDRTNNRLKRHIQYKKQLKQFKKQQKKIQKQQLKEYKEAIKQNEKIRKVYKDITLSQLCGYEEPEDKSYYSSLNLEFGKDGKVK